MMIAFAKGHRFEGMKSVPLAEIAKELYLDRLDCEFRSDFLKRTKASGLELNVVLSSGREDWILELVSGGMGVSIVSESLAHSSNVACKPVTELKHRRQLELVMAEQASTLAAPAEIRRAALVFDWGQ